jgi:hypothetical protein
MWCGWAGLRRCRAPVSSTTAAPLHYWVHGCEPAGVHTYSSRLQYLRLLLAVTGQSPSEHLLAAHLRLVNAA